MKSLFESWYKVGIKAQFRWQATGFSRGTDPILSHPLKIKWWQWWSMIKSLNMMITYSECCSRPGCCSSYTEISFCPYFSPKEISHCSWLVALCAPTLLLRQNLLHCIIGTRRVHCIALSSTQRHFRANMYVRFWVFAIYRRSECGALSRKKN